MEKCEVCDMDVENPQEHMKEMVEKGDEAHKAAAEKMGDGHDHGNM